MFRRLQNRLVRFGKTRFFGNRCEKEREKKKSLPNTHHSPLDLPIECTGPTHHITSLATLRHLPLALGTLPLASACLLRASPPPRSLLTRGALRIVQLWAATAAGRRAAAVLGLRSPGAI